MLIKTLYLSGYKPLALNQIESINIDIVADLTLILGTNGSGKSSLLRELTPYPASLADYREGGEKTITLSYNGNEYVLSSKLNRTAKHSFKRNGIELNDGKTTAVQKELVEKEFNYTIMVHRLLIGDLKFTAMPAGQRREILTAISSVNLEYALYLYKLIKETLRDTIGAVKHVTAKASDLKTKRLNFVVPDNLVEETIELEQKLNKLIPYANTKVKPKQDAIDRIDSGYSRLTQITNRIVKIPTVNTPHENITNNDILNNYIGNCLGKIESAQILINSLTAEVESLNEVNNSVADGTLTVTELQHRIAIIERELGSYPINCFVDRNHEMYIQNLINLTDAIELTHSHFNDVIIFTEDGINILTDQYSKLQLRLTNINQTLENIVVKKQHYISASHTVDCPRCKLRFDLNGTSGQVELLKLNQQEVDYHKEYQEVSKQYALAELDITNIATYKLVKAKYTDLHRSITMPFDFWDTAPAVDAIINNPITMFSHISLWKNNITNGLQRLTLLNELSTCNRALQLSLKYNCNIDVHIAELNETIAAELTKQEQLTNEVAYSRLFIKTVDQYTALEQAAIDSIAVIDSGFRDAIITSIQQDAKSRCDSIYASLAKNKQLTMELDALTRNIKELDADSIVLNQKQTAFNLLDTYLSPTKGLIAEQMLGFISSYINEINNITRSIWEYQLEVKLCNLDNGVLDYTFPLVVEGELVPDIIYGSTGQVDIINLAFTMVMRQYLGIVDFPLYLDETGASFDEVHRGLLMRYILMLIESKQCSQVFMINHYTAVTGGLMNNDTVVLDDRNITTPAEFNNNVKLTYRT